MDATFDGARASFEAIIPIDEQLGVRVRHRPSPRTASAARLFLAFAVVAAWQLATLAPVSARSTILPAVAPLLFGLVSALGFFVPGLKYYRQRHAGRPAG